MTLGNHRTPAFASGTALLQEHHKWCLLLCASLALPASWAQPAPVGAAEVRPPKAAAAKRVESGPSWSELPAHQRVALKPLANEWNGLSETQKRKWTALSRNFDKLPALEQEKLQARMGEWVALSAKDRSRARLNFAETKNLSVDEKQAKWQAYQALSESERSKLAEQAPRRKLPGAATAVSPAPVPRLAQSPVPLHPQARLPRISAAPHQIDPNTLLPQVDPSSAGLSVAPAQ